MRHPIGFFSALVWTCLALITLHGAAAVAVEVWTDGKNSLRVDPAHGVFALAENVYHSSQIPRIIDARPLVKATSLLPEFRSCEVTTHQAVQKDQTTVLIEATYNLRIRAWRGFFCDLISAPQDGVLVHVDQVVLTRQDGRLIMRRFVAEAWDKPIPLKWTDLSDPNLLAENPVAKTLLENAVPPYESFEEYTLHRVEP